MKAQPNECSFALFISRNFTRAVKELNAPLNVIRAENRSVNEHSTTVRQIKKWHVMKDPKNVWKIFISSSVMVATSLIEDRTGNNSRAFQMLGLIFTNVRTQNCK